MEHKGSSEGKVGPTMGLLAVGDSAYRHVGGIDPLLLIKSGLPGHQFCDARRTEKSCELRELIICCAPRAIGCRSRGKIGGGSAAIAVDDVETRGSRGREGSTAGDTSERRHCFVEVKEFEKFFEN